MVKDIKELFEEQARQQTNWYQADAMTPEERAAATKELGLLLYEEASELVKRIDRSRFHILHSQPPLELTEVAHDVVDVFKTLAAISALHGVTPELFAEQFARVTAVVDDKWRGQNLKLAEETRVLLCDLDGCVADWVAGFDKFALQRGIAIAPNGYNHPSLEPLKDEFDRSGGYLALKAMPGAVDVLRAVRAAGVKLIIVTARPYQRFRRVYSDTLEWCRNTGIDFDHIMFRRDKAEAVRAVAPARVIAHIEDRAKHSIEVALAGVTVLKLPCETTENVAHPNIHEVSDWSQIAEWLKLNAGIGQQEAI